MQASRIWVVVACLLMPLVADAERGDVAPRPPDWRGARVKPCRRVEFEGLVTAGHSYRKRIGGGLDFVLEAVPHGWIVRVLPTSGDRPEQDFAEVATPPFRSINPLLLTTDFGFRAQDVVGWNPRTFHYVGTAASFAGAQRAYRATLSSRVPTREQEMAVTQVVMGALEGRLEVVDAALTPGTADQSASASLVSSHFASTAHTFRAPEGGEAGPLGKVLSLRFRVRLSEPERMVCDGSTNVVSNR